ncbi:hypothetical protein POM88_008293 [Heracleum sosnowskyi]|uniref:Aminotransferase class I/classII large domain-containing protein n=1 Tax=Heracleum sosnowskyi TaxID=360622 RepID=A0AAD8N1L2_9APIA|nr:hypothetical protein POM88_008293 [Heracleum sosnowskyi]
MENVLIGKKGVVWAALSLEFLHFLSLIWRNSCFALSVLDLNATSILDSLSEHHVGYLLVLFKDEYYGNDCLFICKIVKRICLVRVDLGVMIAMLIETDMLDPHATFFLVIDNYAIFSDGMEHFLFHYAYVDSCDHCLCLEHPDAQVFSLQIRDTIELISEVTTLSTLEGYSWLVGQYQKAVEEFSNIESMRCASENGYFPDLSAVPRIDIICLCTPNNRTGVVAFREQLTQLVQFAKKNRPIIVYDSDHALYMSDDYPKFIFVIPGEKEIAIEIVNYAGFTKVRLGWTVNLFFNDGFTVAKDFNHCVYFSQAGGLACLISEGLQAMQEVIGFYKENTKIITETFNSLGLYGEMNAPYARVHLLGQSSWDFFSDILVKTHVVTTPGSGFRSGDDDFIRVLTGKGSLEMGTRKQKVQLLFATNSDHRLRLYVLTFYV